MIKIIALNISTFFTAPLRRPHLAIEEIMKGKTSPDPQSEKTGSHLYSIEYLARLAMSPLCLVHPDDWDRISTDYPNLVRKVSLKQFSYNKVSIKYCDFFIQFKKVGHLVCFESIVLL